MIGYAWTLLVASVLPVFVGWAGPVYGIGAALLGVYFLAATWGFGRDRSATQARRVLHASLIYLPSLFALLLLETWFAPLLLWIA
jgi:protoheme IX farnesyltransferase